VIVNLKRVEHKIIAKDIKGIPTQVTQKKNVSISTRHVIENFAKDKVRSMYLLVISYSPRTDFNQFTATWKRCKLRVLTSNSINYDTLTLLRMKSSICC
jgi:hypothetical protein